MHRVIPTFLIAAAGLCSSTTWAHELSPHRTFCGHKQSGLECENRVDGLLEYTSVQTVVTNRG